MRATQVCSAWFRSTRLDSTPLRNDDTFIGLAVKSLRHLHLGASSLEDATKIDCETSEHLSSLFPPSTNHLIDPTKWFRVLSLTLVFSETADKVEENEASFSLSLSLSLSPIHFKVGIPHVKKTVTKSRKRECVRAARRRRGGGGGATIENLILINSVLLSLPLYAKRD